MAAVLVVWELRYWRKRKLIFAPVCDTEMILHSCQYVRCNNTEGRATVKVEYPELQEQRFAKYSNFPDIKILHQIHKLV